MSAKLEPGMPAPDFELDDADGKTWRLADLRGKKVVLYFYPADDTPGCTVEACDFRNAHTELSDSGYVVLGVSPQDANSHRAFSSKYGLNFPLLVDADKRVARAYGAVRGVPGTWEGIPLHVKRSTFIIDGEGRIESALYGVKAKGHVGRIKDQLGLATVSE